MGGAGEWVVRENERRGLQRGAATVGVEEGGRLSGVGGDQVRRDEVEEYENME